MPEEIRKTFHQELAGIQGEVVAMAARVTESLPRATEALLAHDLTVAQAIIDGDDAVDARALSVEEACYRELALQQPMAGDLRAIVAAMWITAEIERSADLVVNICKANRRMFGVEFDPRVRGLIAAMSDEALRLTRLAVDAYVEGNAGLAAALDDIDDRLDDTHSDFITAIFEAHTNDQLDLQPAVQLALIGRYYERIGDHAVNIGERVRYMVTGWMPEHAGAAREAARVHWFDELDEDAATSSENGSDAGH